MVSSKAATVEGYLNELPEDRREAISAVRQVILDNLPAGYEEGMLYGMIAYYIPLKDFPDTYNGQPLGHVGLASQKNYMALYLNSVYSDAAAEKWFRERYQASGKKLDMGKSCVRFKKLADLPLELVGETVAMTPPEKLLTFYKQPQITARRKK